MNQSSGSLLEKRENFIIAKSKCQLELTILTYVAV